MKILLTVSKDSEFKNLTEIVRSAATQTNNELKTWGDFEVQYDETFKKMLERAIDEIDLFIAHFTPDEPDIGVEIGFAMAKDKPVILLCPIDQVDEISANLYTDYIVAYDKNRIANTLTSPLMEILKNDSLEGFIKKTIQQKSDIKTVFVSYSHADSDYLERLKVHMRPFEKKGLVDFWSDTKIKAGAKWRESIITALDKCAIAILLVSADFLASDFIIDNELPPLLKGAEEKGKVILPVIIKPCRFTKEPNISIFQAINLPNLPLSKMDESHREDIYVKIVDTIEPLL